MGAVGPGSEGRACLGLAAAGDERALPLGGRGEVGDADRCDHPQIRWDGIGWVALQEHFLPVCKERVFLS